MVDALTDVLKELLRSDRLIIVGIGNILRGDDGIGVVIARKLRRLFKGLRSIKVIICEAGLENVTHLLMRYRPKHLLIIDAVYVKGGTPGDIYVFGVDELDSYRSITTHHLPLKLTLDYLMTNLNINVSIIGIQVKNTELGSGISEEVLHAGKYVFYAFKELSRHVMKERPPR
ncbi:MAG: hydrogenase maturation protease [Sulfolobales archaeon]